MKLQNTLCVFALTTTLATKLAAQNDAPPPPPPPLPPVAPIAPKPDRVVRERHLDDLTTEIVTQTRAIAGQIGQEARLATEHARIAALDLRRGFRRGNENRTLVLPTNTTRPESLAEGHEDLSVMSRILNKAVEKESRRSGLHGFTFSLGETGGNLDAMYLEGYGAVFLLNVDFPLVPANQANEGKPAAKDEDATWERNKRELRGDDDDDSTFGGSSGSADDGQPKYESEKVDALKRRLIEALKHAKNLRHLHDGEHVTVIVFGKSMGKRTKVGRVVRISDPSGSKTEESSASVVVSENIVGYVNTDSMRQSTLVIRAKKSDITRFAAGELKVDEFARAISVSAF